MWPGQQELSRLPKGPNVQLPLGVTLSTLPKLTCLEDFFFFFFDITLIHVCMELSCYSMEHTFGDAGLRQHFPYLTVQ